LGISDGEFADQNELVLPGGVVAVFDLLAQQGDERGGGARQGTIAAID
jgi:hypothetical protein